MRTLAIVTLVTALTACAEPAETPADSAAAVTTPQGEVHEAVAMTPEQRDGRVIFESVCWTCHGAGGHGDGPAESNDVQPPTFHTRDYAQASAGTLMQRFRASMAGDDPSHPHMQYVAKLVVEDAFAEAVAFIPVLTWPVEIPGSAVNGQSIYQFRCAGCHGTAGRGDGPGAATLVDVRPVDFTTDTLVASGDWDAVYAKIRAGGDRVHGSTMPAWDMILSDAEVWDLVAYLSTFQPGLVAAPSWAN